MVTFCDKELEDGVASRPNPSRDVPGEATLTMRASRRRIFALSTFMALEMVRESPRKQLQSKMYYLKSSTLLSLLTLSRLVPIFPDFRPIISNHTNFVNSL